jgi:hypothetical protein
VGRDVGPIRVERIRPMREEDLMLVDRKVLAILT